MQKLVCFLFLVALIGSSVAINPMCLQPVEVGPCRSLQFRYAYNPARGSCEKFGYGGCQGNANNFATEADCVRACST